MEEEIVRYYAKVDATGKIHYFGGGCGHISSPEQLGKALKFVIEISNVRLINGPELNWDKEHHDDRLGEYQLRALTNQEEQELLNAFHGK